MRLTSLTIYGFKSFAEPTHLEFGPGITGVIGPNGSGKSNIAEAIRWVLGEQSIKSLRGTERTDVIFSGEGKQSSYAKVTLTFNNDSGRFGISSAEVSISRTLSRDGTSQYAINQQPIRLVDLQQLLAEAGIGTKSYTVISQGMIDQYVTAHPEQRRILFDEATGIKSLQIKIAQAEQKIKKSTERAVEVQNILQEIEPRLLFLQRQINRYEQRDAYIAQYKRGQLQYYSDTWHTYAQEIEQATASCSVAERHVADSKKNRIDADTQAISIASQGNSYHQLMDQLTTARATFALETEQWQRVEEEKRMLTSSIQELLLQKQALEKKTKDEPKKQNLHILLRTCKTFLEHLLSEKNIDVASVKDLIHQITTALISPTISTHEESSAISLARVSAIVEERKQRLDSMPSIKKPSDQRIQELNRALEKSPKTTTPIEAEQAREQELEAERKLITAQSLLTQKAEEQTRLEHEIVRECGSEALFSIQHKKQVSSNKFSEHALRELATNIAKIGERDPLIEQEFIETRERAEHIRSQLHDVKAVINQLQHSINALQQTMKTSFNTQFATIAEHFSRYFTDLFSGGLATLTITDQGIEMSATPPGKRTRSTTLLSGGEKALTSLALLFAILDVQKPPFVVLDEVDAALDEANSHRFSTALRNRGDSPQCIVISHNRETMSQADMLYGVTMGEKGVSTTYSVKITDYNT